MSHKILVSTTSTLEGYKIQNYIGVYSAHVVAGTGLLSDMFGVARDIFGGYSQSYQKQLEKVEQVAISQLEQKARSFNANAIIGIRIDHDNISGKGTQMFMVTASGTFVKVQNKEEKNKFADDVIPARALNAQLKKQRMIKEAEKNNLKLDENDFQFISEENFIEIIPFLFQKMEKLINSSNPNKEKYKQMLEQCLLNIFDERIKEYLYKEVERSAANFDSVYKIIDIRSLLDFEKIANLLDHEDFEIQKCAVNLLACDKSSYSSSDIPLIKETIKKLENNFEIKGRFDKQKVILSKGKEVWLCYYCNSNNEIERNICKNEDCKADKYGFYENELKPTKVADVLRKAVVILEQNLNE